MISLILPIILIIVSLLYIRYSYNIGTKKSFRKFLSVAIPIVLAGTGVRIGRLILSDSMMIIFYIAGIGTLLFYAVLRPILQKHESDRYRRITKNSRIFAGFISIFTIWMLLSFLLFFTNMLIPNKIDLPVQVQNILLMPMRILWSY